MAHVEIVMDVFKADFQGHINATHSKTIVIELKKKGAAGINGKSFQAILGYIRQNDLMYPSYIVSNVKKGYWLTKDLQEQDDFMQQELNRMSNQFVNLELLYRRLKKASKTSTTVQPSLFCI